MCSSCKTFFKNYLLGFFLSVFFELAKELSIWQKIGSISLLIFVYSTLVVDHTKQNKNTSHSNYLGSFFALQFFLHIFTLPKRIFKKLSSFFVTLFTMRKLLAGSIDLGERQLQVSQFFLHSKIVSQILF